MPATAQLPELDAIAWYQGGEAPRQDPLEVFGDHFVHYGQVPVDWSMAGNLAQMVNAVQERREHIDLPRYDFAFLGTGDTTAEAIAALADNGIETFEPGIVMRPVLTDDADLTGTNIYMSRYLRSGGTWTPEPIDPEDPEEVLPTETEFTVAVDTFNFLIWFGGYGPPSGIQSGGYPAASGEVDIANGVKIELRGADVAAIDSSYRVQDPSDWLGRKWKFKCFTELRRTAQNIAWVLLNQMVEAVEECARGNPEGEYDFGGGALPASFVWAGEEYDAFKFKSVVYNVDYWEQGTIHQAANPGTTSRLGMDSAFQQVRRILNDLRWAFATEIVAAEGGIRIVYAGYRGVINEFDKTEGVDVPANWPGWPTLEDAPAGSQAYGQIYPDPDILAEILGINVGPSGVLWRAFDLLEEEFLAGPGWVLQRTFAETRHVYLVLVHNTFGVAKTVRFTYNRGNFSTPAVKDPALGLVANHYLGLYEEASPGALEALAANPPPAFPFPEVHPWDATFDIAPYVAGTQVLGPDDGVYDVEIPALSSVYFAFVAYFNITNRSTAAWRPVTDVPIVGFPQNPDTARGTDTNHSGSLAAEVIA